MEESAIRAAVLIIVFLNASLLQLVHINESFFMQ